ncbi:toll/interleukin-1 receptor domain-containing protein [Prevotella melaninogenica]|uniref:toll/interleukin-1 receptor domain-containing protein n=1 Tax=Prevotella melaninogenica TaxID=28132 RepID=UPI00242CB234|nr:TIR domain-containing protein [Prevotella melaninogenica]
MKRKIEYDIALSFAAEDRGYVDDVANILRSKGIRVFYDKFEEANLWGKNLYDYLSDIYANKAYYIIMFISKNYCNKLWTNHERVAMQSRAFQEEHQEYILPAKFDDTKIPSLPPTVGYISLEDKQPADFCEIILKKLILSGRTVPSELTRSNSSSLIKIPKVTPLNFNIELVNERLEPIAKANVCLIADNDTCLKAVTNENGFASININVRRKYSLFVASENYPSYVLDEIDPQCNIKIKLHSSENIGAIICDSTGYIPGLKGRLNPILDTLNRTYLYADNIAINGGKIQPVTFEIDEPLDLEDCEGVIMQITVKSILGNISLIEFVRPIIEE